MDPTLQRLMDVAGALAGERDVPALLNRILDSVIGLTGAERGFLLLHDDGWRVVAARNMEQEEITRAQEKISRTLLGRLREARRPLLLHDADLPGAESLQGQKVRAVCAVPIGEAGAVYLDHRGRPDAFRETDIELIGAFAGLAAVTLENARLSEALSRRVEAQAEELADARAAIAARNRFENMTGASRPMQELYRLIEKAAASPYPVLLQGESGTGKELAARAIHGRSARREAPFIAANCGAISDALLASELFGHVRGAFTGAGADRAGLFELAAGGTLFLDEVGTMSAEMQESLLRAVEEREIRRVGSTRTLPVDVRIVAASNADLALMADRGEFRSDLYYRLNVIRIDLPPLRERREDIPALVEQFLDRAAAEMEGPRRRLAPEALERLVEHSWPGNVRELENAVRRAVALSESDVLDAGDFRFLQVPANNTGPSGIVHIDEYMRRVVLENEGKLGLREIADRLGVSRKTLWEKKKKWGLS